MFYIAIYEYERARYEDCPEFYERGRMFMGHAPNWETLKEQIEKRVKRHEARATQAEKDLQRNSKNERAGRFLKRAEEMLDILSHLKYYKVEEEEE